MNAYTAIRQIIESMPNFFGLTQKVTIGAEGETETRVYTQEDIASHVAANLADKIHTKGCLVVELPPVETDEYGSRTVRVPMNGQAWAYGEVRISDQGDRLVIVDIPSRLPIDDAPAFAAAVLAAYNAARTRR
ncbi:MULTISPECIES: hypothetical protein [Mycobacteriaceae]|uniref:hypothetical protein n=1 Tax=Mycobacteriaceae TaxID=1762 RepID=UPI000992C039|nr:MULTISPECIES: hypothetical protein [Mycobacteriaceae]MDO3058491.1 hypothetical protein [Mycobacteroides abscessus subsp. abscessus]MDO3277973.1 hypothetical protein [Mycobacteroides abscessus subsp. abscessus]